MSLRHPVTSITHRPTCVKSIYASAILVSISQKYCGQHQSLHRPTNVSVTYKYVYLRNLTGNINHCTVLHDWKWSMTQKYVCVYLRTIAGNINHCIFIKVQKVSIPHICVYISELLRATSITASSYKSIHDSQICVSQKSHRQHQSLHCPTWLENIQDSQICVCVSQKYCGQHPSLHCPTLVEMISDSEIFVRVSQKYCGQHQCLHRRVGGGATAPCSHDPGEFHLCVGVW